MKVKFVHMGMSKKMTVFFTKYQLLLFLLLSSWAACEVSIHKQGAEQYRLLCASCHGIHAEGKIELNAPNLAGLPNWYTKVQLEKFKSGIRGKQDRDHFSQAMYQIMQSISDSKILSIANYLESTQPQKETTQTITGDLKNGKWLFREHCMACHRYNGSGELVFGSPPIRMLSDWYVKAQLKKFKSGLRGAHPKDHKGAKMREVVKSLREESDMDDIIVYLQTL